LNLAQALSNAVVRIGVRSDEMRSGSMRGIDPSPICGVCD
jgi:hypothetical protein